MDTFEGKSQKLRIDISSIENIARQGHTEKNN